MVNHLDNILGFSQLHPTSSTSLAPLTPPTVQRDSPAIGEDRSHDWSCSDSEDSDNDGDNDNDRQAIQAPSRALELDSPDAINAFTINTARNLGLTANGEKSLIQFSQVFLFSPPTFTTFTRCLKLDLRSSLIYQQATLIKLGETHLRYGSAVTTQGSGANDQLALPDQINVIYCDFS
jgi:hypothetical protein